MKNTVDLKILGNPLLLVILLFIVVIIVLSIVNYFKLEKTKNVIENFYQENMAESNGGTIVGSDGSTYTSYIKDPCEMDFYDSKADRYFNCKKDVGKYNAAEGGYCPGNYNRGSDELCYPLYES